jgi:hypothetical protein
MLELRHGPLTLDALAGYVGAAPFNVRHDLRTLKRERMVRDVFQLTWPPSSSDRHVWELTPRGRAFVFAGDQVRLDVTPEL